MKLNHYSTKGLTEPVYMSMPLIFVTEAAEIQFQMPEFHFISNLERQSLINTVQYKVV